MLIIMLGTVGTEISYGVISAYLFCIKIFAITLINLEVIVWYDRDFHTVWALKPGSY